jgi:hypothetical protein
MVPGNMGFESYRLDRRAYHDSFKSACASDGGQCSTGVRVNLRRYFNVASQSLTMRADRFTIQDTR